MRHFDVDEEARLKVMARVAEVRAEMEQHVAARQKQLDDKIAEVQRDMKRRKK